VSGRLIPRAELSAAERDAMFALLSSHFEGATRDGFERDLDEKDWAVLLDGGEGGLAGFSTLQLYETRWRGRPLSVLYSGDTIVDPTAWGRTRLSRAWIGAVSHLRRTRARGDLHWLLLSAGFRTYRYLPLFWREFHPRFDAATPPARRALIDALARERFGDAYAAAEGVVRFPGAMALRGALRAVSPERRADPHVAHFLRANPGWERGDELVCWTRVAPDNLTAAGRRMWAAGERAFGAARQPA